MGEPASALALQTTHAGAHIGKDLGDTSFSTASEERLIERFGGLAAERIVSAAVIYALGYTLAMGTGELIHHLVIGAPWDLNAGHIAAFASIGVAFGFAAWARYGNLSPRAGIRLGLAFEVVGAFGIGLGTMYLPWSPDFLPVGISWICVWIVVYPIVVPAPPRRAFFAATLAALSGPASIAFYVFVVGNPNPDLFFWLMATIPNLICVELGWFGARTVYRMGQALDRAQQMGSYHLERLLGAGGMGEVWLASHRMLARPAAIKLIRPEVLGDGTRAGQALQRFEREARVISALSSPHTVVLYDFGSTERDGSLYYVMELLYGLDLQALVARFGPLDPARAVFILRQICLSLAEAHEAGLVHRDVKPANVFLARQGMELDFVKVLDFGLARAVRQESVTVTRDHVAVGTPAFMSPEAARGRPLDHRTDLYAVGCVGYWLLTGVLVFRGESPIDVLSQHIQAKAEPPSAHAELPIPPELDALILDCLAKDPADRPANAQQILARLDAIAFPAPWNQERARAWWKQHIPEHLQNQTASSALPA